MRKISRLLAVLLCLFVVSCGEPSSPPGPAAFMKVVSGNSQTGVVGAALASPVVVQIMDALGRPAVGQSVSFRVLSGGGSVSAGSAVADAEGMAQERWTLGPVAGRQQMEARASDAQTGSAVSAAFEATAVPGAAVVIAGGTISIPLALWPRTVTFLVQDALGNGVDGVSVSVTPGPGSGSVSPPTVVTQNGGQATTNWKVGPLVGDQTLTATVAGIVSLTIHQQMMAFSDVAAGRYTGPVTLDSVVGNWGGSDCEGTKSFLVPANLGVLDVGSIGDDGSFISTQQHLGVTFTTFQGVILVDAVGNATASGTLRFSTVGMGCTGTFTAMVRQ
jgi:hypothetical protein